MPDLAESMKKVAMAILNNEMVSTFMFGVVTEEKPLKILVEQRLELDNDFLVLTKNLIKDEDLKKGERVVLIRQHGGQKYLVVDRVV